MSPERLPETSPDGANLGYGAHEFTPTEPAETPRPTPDTSGADAEPPVPPNEAYRLDGVQYAAGLERPEAGDASQIADLDHGKLYEDLNVKTSRDIGNKTLALASETAQNQVGSNEEKATRIADLDHDKLYGELNKKAA